MSAWWEVFKWSKLSDIFLIITVFTPLTPPNHMISCIICKCYKTASPTPLCSNDPLTKPKQLVYSTNGKSWCTFSLFCKELGFARCTKWHIVYLIYKKTSLGQNSLHAYLFILFADSKVLGSVPGLVIDSRKKTVMLLFDPVCWDQIRSATQYWDTSLIY